jgi:hypothetical protein
LRTCSISPALKRDVSQSTKCGCTFPAITTDRYCSYQAPPPSHSVYCTTNSECFMRPSCAGTSPHSWTLLILSRLRPVPKLRILNQPKNPYPKRTHIFSRNSEMILAIDLGITV